MEGYIDSMFIKSYFLPDQIDNTRESPIIHLGKFKHMDIISSTYNSIDDIPKKEKYDRFKRLKVLGIKE